MSSAELAAEVQTGLRVGLMRVLGLFARRRFGTWYLSKTQPAIDRALYRASRGRCTLAGFGTGVQMLMLTSTGARTGQERLTPLATVPEPDGSFLLLASNFGRASDPGWAFNLRAHPHALISYRGHTCPVRAEELDDRQRTAARSGPLAMLPAWRRYDDLPSGRIVPIFRLHPVDAGTATP